MRAPNQQVARTNARRDLRFGTPAASSRVAERPSTDWLGTAKVEPTSGPERADTDPEASGELAALAAASRVGAHHARVPVTNALELVRRVARGAEALSKLATAGAREPGVETGRHRAVLRRDGDRSRANGQQQSAQRFGIEGSATQRAFEGDHAHGPDVRAMIERACAFCLLGAHVIRRAEHRARARGAGDRGARYPVSGSRCLELAVAVPVPMPVVPRRAHDAGEPFRAAVSSRRRRAAPSSRAHPESTAWSVSTAARARRPVRELLAFLRGSSASGCWPTCLSALAHAPAADARPAAARELGRVQAADYEAAPREAGAGRFELEIVVVARALQRGKLRGHERSVAARRVGGEAVQKRALADRNRTFLLTPKIPSVTVRIEGAPAEVHVQIDGVAIAQELVGEARLVNPGPHKIDGQRGTEQAVVELVLAESEQKPAILRFGNGAAAPSRPRAHGASVPSSDAPSAGLGQQRTFALIAAGVGVVGIGVGTVFGFKSKSHHDEAEKYCNGSECTDVRGVNAGTDAHAAGNVSTVAMIVGGVGLAGAAVLWFTAPRSAVQSARLGVGIGFSALQVRGRF